MQRVAAGSYALDDLAWFEGCTSPVPIAQIFAKTPPPVTPPPTPAPASSLMPEIYSAEELARMADLQKKLLLLGVGWIGYVVLCCFVSLLAPLAERIVLLVASGYWIRWGWKLSKLLRHRPWVWVIFLLVPLLNFYAWGRILWTSTRMLRTNGVACAPLDSVQAALSR
jgi:hypothetical protein